MSDDDHPQYALKEAGAFSTLAPTSSVAASGSTDLMRKGETDTALAGKAASSHTHAASDITSGVFAVARLATGTPDGTKFVRDDGTLAVPAGGGLANDSVTDVILRNSVALSVIGRASNSTGDPADIAAGTDGHVLRRSGTTLGFGTLAAGAFASNTAAYATLVNSASAGLSVLGRSTNSAGALAEIATTTDGHALRLSGSTLGFGTIATAGITDAAITSAKMANMEDGTLKGRPVGAGAGVPSNLSGSDVRAIADVRYPHVYTIWAGPTVNWAVPSAETLFLGSAPWSCRPYDGTRATQARITACHAGAASSGSVHLTAKYTTNGQAAGTYNTVGTWTQLGASAQVVLTLGTGAGANYLDSGWINIASGAKIDGMIAVTGDGGNGSTSVTFYSVNVEFR